MHCSCSKRRHIAYKQVTEENSVIPDLTIKTEIKSAGNQNYLIFNLLIFKLKSSFLK
jgi:hypothetical protein